VITEAVARGYLDAPGFFDDALVRRAWLGNALDRRRARAARPALGDRGRGEARQHGRLDARRGDLELTGGDWERKHHQRVKETRMRREAGLDGELVAERIRTEPTTPQPPDDAPDDGEDAEPDAPAAPAPRGGQARAGSGSRRGSATAGDWQRRARLGDKELA
jgi:hypothetical protein